MWDIADIFGFFPGMFIPDGRGGWLLNGIFTVAVPSVESIGKCFEIDLANAKFLPSVNVKSFGPYRFIGYWAIFYGSVASFSFSAHGVGIEELISRFTNNGFWETEAIVLGGITYRPGLYIAISPDKRYLYVAQVMRDGLCET